MSAEGAGEVRIDLGPVVIRSKRNADAFDDYVWQRDEETSRLDGSGGTSLSLSEYLSWREAEYLPTSRRRWLAMESAEGVHFGTLVVFNAEQEPGMVEVGITIGRPEYRGRGLGTLALIGLLRTVWATTPIRRVCLHVFEWNERALRSFRRAGFQDVARLRRGAEVLVRMEARREWWLLWDGEGRFRGPASQAAGTVAPGADGVPVAIPEPQDVTSP